MGRLFTLLLVGLGAVFMWKNRAQPRCPHCERPVRAGATTCRHCGEAIASEGPTIDVKAEPR